MSETVVITKENTNVTVDNQRRVVLPKSVLEAAGFDANQLVSVVYDKTNDVIVLIPLSLAPRSAAKAAQE